MIDTLAKAMGLPCMSVTLPWIVYGFSSVKTA